MNPFHILLSCLSGPWLLSGLHTEIFVFVFLLSHAYHKLRPFNPSWFHHSNNIWREHPCNYLQPYCCFLPLRLKCSSQHLVIKRPHPIFFPQYKTQFFTPLKKAKLLYVKFYILRQQTWKAKDFELRCSDILRIHTVLNMSWMRICLVSVVLV
jgi:hypothetical protein